MPDFDAKDKIRFHKNRSKEITKMGCCEWMGSKNKAGYGVFSRKSTTFLAHRVSFFMANGIDPVGFLVCHSCDNPPCVNPVHLWLGDKVSNAADMVQKGRHSSVVHPEKMARGAKNGMNTHPEARRYGDFNPSRYMKHKMPRGSRHGMAKLSEKDVLHIRELKQAGVKHRDLAKQFGVHRSMIGLIVHRKNWTHI